MTRRIHDARVAALQLLAECGIETPRDIDMDVLAAAKHAEVIDDDIDGATASVLRLGKGARIRVSNRIDDPGWRRFSIAHELGHLTLNHGVSSDASDSTELVCRPLERVRSIAEREANVFASELVMPEPMVRPKCRAHVVTLAPARAIACEFGTSLLASAMRFVELTDECCAVAYSTLGRVRWLKPSATFPTWMPRGRSLDPRSAAFNYHDTGTLETAPQVVTADVWLPRDKLDGANVRMVEHTAAIPALGAAISMLWIPVHELRHRPEPGENG